MRLLLAPIPVRTWGDVSQAARVDLIPAPTPGSCGKRSHYVGR